MVSGPCWCSYLAPGVFARPHAHQLKCVAGVTIRRPHRHGMSEGWRRWGGLVTGPCSEWEGLCPPQAPRVGDDLGSLKEEKDVWITRSENLGRNVVLSL